jgi:hypothetical protein
MDEIASEQNRYSDFATILMCGERTGDGSKRKRFMDTAVGEAGNHHLVHNMLVTLIWGVG